jgi:hypothetical protein
MLVLPDSSTHPGEIMKLSKIIVGFVPLVAYGLVSQWISPGWAAVIGLIVTVAVIGVTAAQGGVKILPVVTGVILVPIAVVAFADPGADAFLSDYGRAIASLCLGVFILATLSIMPFTEQMARESVPSELWHTAKFREVNQKLSALWGAVVLGSGVANVLAGALTHADAAPAVATLLRLGVPVLGIVYGLKITKQIAEHAAAAPAQ